MIGFLPYAFIKVNSLTIFHTKNISKLLMCLHGYEILKLGF